MISRMYLLLPALSEISTILRRSFPRISHDSLMPSISIASVHANTAAITRFNAKSRVVTTISSASVSINDDEALSV